jgi:hypothetical protein
MDNRKASNAVVSVAGFYSEALAEERSHAEQLADQVRQLTEALSKSQAENSKLKKELGAALDELVPLRRGEKRDG